MGEGGGNNNHISRSKTKKPSFFKVLIGDFTKQLRVPRAFLHHFNGKLPEQSILESPTGKYWVVEMKKVEKDLVFRDGWTRFVKKHSLEFGDFLVFRYNGTCKFKVKIYAKNACEKEIDPVLSNKTTVESNSHKKKQKVDHVVTEKCTKVPRFDENSHHVKEKKNDTESKSHMNNIGSVRNARLETESNVMVNPKKELVEESERRFVLVKDESDDSSIMWL